MAQLIVNLLIGIMATTIAYELYQVILFFKQNGVKGFMDYVFDGVEE